MLLSQILEEDKKLLNYPVMGECTVKVENEQS